MTQCLHHMQGELLLHVDRGALSHSCWLGACWVKVGLHHRGELHLSAGLLPRCAAACCTGWRQGLHQPAGRTPVREESGLYPEVPRPDSYWSVPADKMKG